MISAEPQDPAELLLVEARRVVDRLRAMPLSRLPTLAPQAHAAAAELASLTVPLEPGRAPQELPWVSDTCVGEQVAVTAGDLLAAAQGCADDELARSAVRQGAGILTTLRRSL